MIRSVAATGLLAVGSLLIALSVALLGRAYVGQWVDEVQRPAVVGASLPARLDAVPTQAVPVSPESHSPTPVLELEQAKLSASSDDGVPSAAEVAVGLPAPPEAIPTSTPGPLPEASPTPMADFGRPVRLVIPSIDLNAQVTGVGIKNGVYEIPWWDVGWHEDSALLGVPGNTIFNGHVDTLDAGRVFNQLHRLEPGDLVYVYSSGYRTTWVVELTDRVPNSEQGFVGPTDDIRVTLYTCEGSFNWGTRRYSHYRVVVARFVDASRK